MNKRTDNFNLIGHVLEFEKSNTHKAIQLLECKYNIPKSDSFGMAHKIFKQMCDITIAWNDYSFDKLWSSFNNIARIEAKIVKLKMSKNFNLTEKSFNDLVTKLKHGDESVFEHVFLSHMNDCISFIKNKFKIDHEVAYDVSMDALIAFRKKLIGDKIKYGNLRFLFTQMASQLYLKQIKKEEKQSHVTSIFEDYNYEEDLNILEKALDKMGEGCIELIKLNFYEKLSLKEIAEIQSKTAVALRKQKQRCLTKLKSLFHQYSA